MSAPVISFTRRFQMWTYTVGHGQLLLRSPKALDVATRIDVLFKDVAAVNLPTLCDGLEVSELSEGEEAKLFPQLDSLRVEGRKIFEVLGANFKGYVVAGVVAWHEDEGDYNDPSHFQLTPN